MTKPNPSIRMDSRFGTPGQFRQQGKAFTLIELLVVIAIISLLVSILLPSLNKAKDLARQVTCQSNKRQASLSFLMYVQENDGTFPYNNRTGTVDTYAILNHFWSDNPQYYLIKPYIASDDIFQCPSADEVLSGDGYVVTTTFYSNTLAGVDDWGDYVSAVIDPANVAAVRNAAETILLGDSIHQVNMVWSPEADVFDYFKWGFLYNGNYCHGAPAGLRDNLYHNGGYTLSFVDGRAEWFAAGTEPIDDGTWWDLE